MLYFIAVWLILGVTCWSLGFGILALFCQHQSFRLGDRSILAIWIGIVVHAVLLLAVSLFVPLKPLTGLGVMVFPAAFMLLRSPIRAELFKLIQSVRSPLVLIGFSISLWFLAAFMATQVTWLDTGLYHYSAIRWLREFGTVPGLVLLDEQLGFTSSWFALAAPLNPAIFEGRVSAVTNGFVMLLVMVHCAISIRQYLTPSRQLSDGFIVFFSILTVPLILVTRLLSTVLISPSPDIPIVFLIGVTTWSILLISQADEMAASVQEKSWVSGLIPIILSAGTVSLKLIAIPLVPVSILFYALFHRFSFGRLLTGILMAIGLLIPFMANGILTSSCPLYPSTVLCLDLPWSPQAEEVRSIAEETHGWSTWFGSPPEGANPVFWLFWKWLTSIGSSSLIVLLILLSITSLVYILWVLKKQAQRTHSTPEFASSVNEIPAISAKQSTQWMGFLCLIGLSILGTIFIMLKAPLLRFGIGYFVLLPAFALAFVMGSIVQNKPPLLPQTPNLQTRPFRQPTRYLSLFGMAVIAVTLFSPTIQSQLFLPPPLPDAEVIPRTINTVVYFAPQDSRGTCWASELPCAGKPRTDIQLRSPDRGVSAGFARVRQ